MTHTMLDIETIGTRPGAIVLSAAFVRFTDEAHTTLNLSIPDQEAFGQVRAANALGVLAGVRGIGQGVAA